MESTLKLRGTLAARKIACAKAPLTWRLRNALRVGYLWGLVTVALARFISRVFGIVTVTSELQIQKILPTGRAIDYGVVSRRVITTAGVNFMVDAWQGSVEPETMKYHGCGTGTNAENSSDSALQTECTTALNPDSTRATGTLAEGASANIFSSVGTLTFDASAAVTEHGLFNQAATGGGTLWDRSVFSAINVASGDSIQFTYQATLSAGG
jgi:hypothetical protein